MKKMFILTLLIFTFISCAPKLFLNNKGNNSLLGKINEQIEIKNISKKSLIYLNNQEISKEKLKKINVFELNDFTEISFINKGNEKNGVINITSFLDPKLDYKYYKSINNKDIQKLIKKLYNEGITNKNPLLVLSGKPLRGEEIATKINNTKIVNVSVLKKEGAYKIYGIRAINGVILLDTTY